MAGGFIAGITSDLRQMQAEKGGKGALRFKDGHASSGPGKEVYKHVRYAQDGVLRQNNNKEHTRES